MSDDTRHMAHALSLARRALGRCAPNPAVGCVVVKAGRVIGRGWTQPGGRPHAETQALAQAGNEAAGADVYVTLEPCAHHGKTPPCAQALIAARVARVVFAATDPDPRVNGAGAAMLEAAGIDVRHGEQAEAAERTNAGFMLRVEEGRPLVTLKLASSFDGRIATGTGESQWITGELARRRVHAMRGAHDAVMVGGGTARHDDPMLTVRGLGITHQPTRVVISRRLDLPLMGKLARSARETPLIVCHGHDADAALMHAWRDIGATLVPCAARAGQLDPLDVLRQLASRGITRVFCEGGSALAASLMDAGVVDRLVTFTAGMAIGAEGLPSIGALGLGKLQEAPRFRLVRNEIVGADTMQVWHRAPG